MLRLLKWVAPVAALALLAGFNQGQVRAADEAAAAKATVNVTVVDKDGKGVEGARVRLMAPPKKAADAATANAAGDTPAPKKGGGKAIAQGKTDKDGKVALSGVPDGEYVVNAGLKAQNLRGMEKVTVADGKDVSVTVTVKETAPKADAGAAPAGNAGDAK